MKCQRRTYTSCGSTSMACWEQRREKNAHRERLRGMRSCIDLRCPEKPHRSNEQEHVARKVAAHEAWLSDLASQERIRQIRSRTPTGLERRPTNYNRRSQKLEQKRVDVENVQNEKRLQNVRSTLSTRQWLQEHRTTHQQHLMNMSHTKRLVGGYDDCVAARGKSVSEASLQLGKETQRPASAGAAGRNFVLELCNGTRLVMITPQPPPEPPSKTGTSEERVCDPTQEPE